ncbi:endonuclease/exonuclease/phosphatase family protein [Geitlerinema sp. CS-897]|nr:endonuclease/exonuclease/phosphatase family protein [Geitlerinema sp. CS-897]
MSIDRISQALQDFVPDVYQGSDEYLDIITWNVRFFNDLDPERVRIVRQIFEELNADIFVLQEVAEGSLDGIADELTQRGAGFYETIYGLSGGDIRVAFLYDTEWVRATTEPEELFAEDSPTVQVGRVRKPVFPRYPLQTRFVALSAPGSPEPPFDFHLVGVHLKSQRDSRRGHRSEEQRTAAAKLLAEWLQNEAVDEDVIIAGDWNASPFQSEWEVLRNLEAAGQLRFANWNHDSEGSHFFSSGYSSRLDFIAVTSQVEGVETLQERSKVINWNLLLENGVSQSLREQLRSKISDHLPVLTRFYFTESDRDEEVVELPSESVEFPGVAVLGSVKIVAANVNPAGKEAGHETVTLLNLSPDTVDLSGWGIRDRLGRQHSITSLTVPGGETVRVVLDAGTAQLSNRGGSIILVNDRDDEVHSVTYTRQQVSKQGWSIAF